MALFDVNFAIVKAEGGQTAAERFAAASFTKDSKTFYIVGTDIYVGDVKLSNAPELEALITRLDGGENVTNSIRNVIRSYLTADEVEYKAEVPESTPGAGDGEAAVSVEDALDELYGKFTNLTAAEVAVADANDNFEAVGGVKNVEIALSQLGDAVSDAQAAGEVTLESSTEDTNYARVYSLYQGVLETDDAAAKAAKKIGDINIPRDFLVRSASIATVATVDTPYAGAAVGDKYIDFVVNTISDDATATHIYLAVNDLVDVYTATPANQTAEVTVAIDSNNDITATIGKVAATKIVYRAAADAQGNVGDPDYVPAVTEQTVKQKIDAIDVYIGTIPTGATSTNVVDYVNEKTGDGVGALNAEVATGATGDDAVVPTADVATQRDVISEFTQANGKITAAKKVTLEDVAITGAAEDVSITTTDFGVGVTDVEAALQTIANRLTWTEV